MPSPHLLRHSSECLFAFSTTAPPRNQPHHNAVLKHFAEHNGTSPAIWLPHHLQIFMLKCFQHNAILCQVDPGQGVRLSCPDSLLCAYDRDANRVACPDALEPVGLKAPGCCARQRLVAIGKPSFGAIRCEQPAVVLREAWVFIYDGAVG